MAWRLRLHTKRHYIDFEWGRQQQEEQQPEQTPAPVMNDQPMQVYAEPLGFRMLGGDGVIATEVETRSKDRGPSADATAHAETSPRQGVPEQP